MFNRSRRRSGFTLPEVLVTVAIVAVLAAVVVPTVTQQMGKADGPALASSIGSLRTSITAFVSDVRKFPMRLSHLSTQITALDTTLVVTELYGSAANRWKGPYAAFSISGNDSLSLGMDLKAADSLQVANNQIEVWLGGVTSDAEMVRIDALIDNSTGAAAGALRWTPSGPSATLMKYILMGAQ
jgi:prepilin-type N-terminal cleavage/methylation domain-containing protein